jgi:uncharacterized spore protein YtfJ
MKKFIVVLLMVSVVFGMSSFTLAQGGEEKSTEFIKILAAELKTLLDADNVLGTPIEHAGLKIIPIVEYGFGFGGGSGTGGDARGQGAGTGAGSGGGIIPVSFLVITQEGDVQVITARKGELGEIMKAVAPMIIEAVKTRQMQTPKKPQEEEPEKEKK